MSSWRRMLTDERGVALVLALMVLLTLTGLVLAFLSVSALEPQISRNLADTARARYLAEAGVEIAFNQLVTTPDWSSVLAGATSSNQWVALQSNATLPGLTSSEGTFSVIVRNDAAAADTALTGEAAADAAGWDGDGNGVLIIRATGSFKGATRTVEVVTRRLALPPFPGAVNIPGYQSDTYLNNNTSAWEIDGRDYTCASDCDNQLNWTTTDPAGTRKYGIAVQPGVQANNGNTYEQNVENAANTSTKRANIKGKSEVDDGFTTGYSTIEADSSLTPTAMTTFLGKLAAFPGTQILQSTMACPMVLSGGANSSDPNDLTNTPTLTNGCGLEQTLDLGTRDNPKLLYVRGAWDPSSSFTGLRIAASAGVKGAGIIVVEDGDLKNYGALQWDGLVIVNGAFVSAAWMSGSRTTIRGALTALEGQAGEMSGYFDFYMHSGIASFSARFSQDMLTNVQRMRALHQLSGWREL